MVVLFFMNSRVARYVGLGGTVAIVAFVSHFAPSVFSLFAQSTERELLLSFFSVSVLFLLSFASAHSAKKTIIPPFVAAIFFGLAARPLLVTITEHEHILGIIVGIGATLILFSGGLETPFANFRKLFAKILSLSFIGLSFTALALSLAVVFLGNVFGAPLSLSAAVLLGAVLASTDPAAIIPVLKKLRFRNRSTKDLIISESALTDVTGTLLTVAFLGLLTAGVSFDGVFGAYTLLFSREVALILAEEVVFGLLFGVFGFVLLQYLSKCSKGKEGENESHAAYFLFVPIIIFTFAVAFHGSGYLAAFVAGLLFVLAKHMHNTEHFFNHTIEGFFKPTIFVLLGALVDVRVLLAYAPIGLAAAAIFMFVIRPIAVFLSLAPLSFSGQTKLSVREMLFISFVRETGAIPAVLLATIASSGIPGSTELVPVGMWVILSTLVFQPPLTPYVARVLGVAEAIEDAQALVISKEAEPFVVLGSRGHSFDRRLPYVAEWAGKHYIARVVVLVCLEGGYTEEEGQRIEREATRVFAAISAAREKRHARPVTFELINRTGFLQDNIDELAKKESAVTAIFVGRKVLDFGLEKIKHLAVPLFFID